MRPSDSTWRAALIVSAAALLSFLTRTFIDYRFVYPELNLSTRAIGWVTLVNLLFYGGWIWALMAAAQRVRRALFVLLAYDIVLVIFGITTRVSLCPLPCRTMWPVGEIAIWSNLLIGAAATVLAALSLFRKASAIA